MCPKRDCGSSIINNRTVTVVSVTVRTPSVVSWIAWTEDLFLHSTAATSCAQNIATHPCMWGRPPIRAAVSHNIMAIRKVVPSVLLGKAYALGKWFALLQGFLQTLQHYSSSKSHFQKDLVNGCVWIIITSVRLSSWTS